MERERDELVAVAAGIVNAGVIAGRWAGLAFGLVVTFLVCYFGLVVFLAWAAVVLTRRAYREVMARHDLAGSIDEPIPYTVAPQTAGVDPSTPETIILEPATPIDMGGYPGRDVDEMADRSSLDFLALSTAPEEAWLNDEVPADTAALPCCCSPTGGEVPVDTMTSAAQTTTEAPGKAQDCDQRYRDVLVGVDVGGLSVKAACKARGVPESSYRTWAKKQKRQAV